MLAFKGRQNHLAGSSQREGDSSYTRHKKLSSSTSLGGGWGEEERERENITSPRARQGLWLERLEELRGWKVQELTRRSTGERGRGTRADRVGVNTVGASGLYLLWRPTFLFLDGN